MNVAIFGGTFDPVHRGHIEVARAAQRACDLGRIYFIPADIPPHKQRVPITPYYHRYAMLALATAGEATFLPSLMEAPGEEARRTPSFTIETVRRFRALLPKSDRLFFLIGMDAFLDIAKWHRAEDLLREVEFIVSSRPGFSLADVARALPEGLRPPEALTRPFRGHPATGDLAVGGTMLHLLAGVEEKVSASQVRAAAARGRAVGRLLDPKVVEYIRKMHLYKSPARPGTGKVVQIRQRS
jgi:nicotinate-nucleotide adenylyltransferase